MAYGIEVVLGWTCGDFRAAAEALGIRLPVTDADWTQLENMGGDDWLFRFGGVKGRFVENLKIAHHEAMEAADYTFVRSEKRVYGEAAFYQTPWGEREIRPFGPQMYYDQTEMEDEREDAVFGVSIAARYRPVFLDMPSEHGTLKRFVLDSKTQRLVDIAYGALSKHIPGFATSNLVVLQRHY